MIYISGPLVGITHECYFMIVDLDLLTCDIGDASATCSWASSPLGMIMALTEHRFHPFSLSFSATWLSPSSHRVTAKSYTDLRRMELERGKKCADAQMLVPSHARKTQLISQAARTCENTDFTTWFHPIWYLKHRAKMCHQSSVTSKICIFFEASWQMTRWWWSLTNSEALGPDAARRCMNWWLGVWVGLVLAAIGCRG